MQRSDDSVAPIIIKRKTIINSSAHHGGAWKVAYADFVTAMMYNHIRPHQALNMRPPVPETLLKNGT